MLSLIPAALRPWIIGGAAALVLAAIGGAGVKGYSLGAAARDGYWQALRADELDRRASVTAATEAAGVRRAVQRDVEISDLQKQVDAYEAQLSRECLVPDADAERLRNIR